MNILVLNLDCMLDFEGRVDGKVVAEVKTLRLGYLNILQDELNCRIYAVGLGDVFLEFTNKVTAQQPDLVIEPINVNPTDNREDVLRSLITDQHTANPCKVIKVVVVDYPDFYKRLNNHCINITSYYGFNLDLLNAVYLMFFAQR